MSATITDKFNKAADGNGSYPTLATVSATRSASEATLACQDLTGWATDTPVHFSTYQLNSSGVVDTTTQTDWKGIVSGNTITNLTRIAGAADTGNAIGDIVELNPTIGWLDDLVTGLLASHKQDGSLKDNIVKSNNIDSAAIGTAKIADSAVTTAKIANSAVTSSKIDFTTLKPRWKVVATSTSQSVTIPAGYRKYRISFGYNKPGNSWGVLVCAQKTSSSWIYIQGVNNAQWVQAERECQASDKAVLDLSRTSVGAGFALYTIDLSRNTKTATSIQGTYQATCEGSLTYVTGKIGFSITNGSNSFSLSPYDAGSNYSWVVEAFDE